MTDTEKLKLLQDVGNELVDALQTISKMIEALEIILVAVGARDQAVTVEAANPAQAIDKPGKLGGDE